MNIDVFKAKADNNFKANLSRDLHFIKGIAILLVVIGHVIGSNKNVGMRQMYKSDIFGLTWLADFIYTFHMPLFFIASGVAFTVFSNSDISYLEFARSKFKRLFIPLICWAPPFFFFQSFTRRKSFDFFNVVNAVIHPYAIFWFIHSLIFATFFAFICFKLFKSQLIYILLSLLILFLSFYLKEFIIYWNIFYAFGVSIALYLPSIRSILQKLKTSKILLTLLSCVISMLLVNCFSHASYSAFIEIINGVISMLLLYIIAVTFQTKFQIKWLIKALQSAKNIFLYLGKISMVTYLFHIYFCTSVRIVLVKVFGITQPSIHFVLGFTAATVGPIIFYNFLRTRSKIFRYSIGEFK